MNKKVLLITRNLPPLVGGMETLNLNMATELSKDFNLTIIGPSKSRAYIPSNVNFIGVPLTPVWLFLIVSFCKTIAASLTVKPAVILAGSGLMAPAAYFAARLCGGKSFVYTHGLDIVVPNFWYKKLWLPFIRKADLVIANSTFTRNLVYNLRNISTNIPIINPGISEQKGAAQSEVKGFKKKYNLEESKTLITIGRLTARKGILEFVEKSLPKIVQQQKNVNLVIVGDTPKNALHGKVQSQSSIMEAARKNNLQDRIIFLGKVPEKELCVALSAADVHIFPVITMEGDPEGFGMVAVEAAAYGIPSVAFATGGVPDAIGHEVSGVLIQEGDYAQLTQKVLSLLDSNYIKKEDCINFSKQFLWSEFRIKLSTLINNTTK